MNEATARIKINRLLEKSGWRFFPEGNLPANIRMEQQVAILPGIEFQQATRVIANAKQVPVKDNRELITRFERKIQDTIGRVWDTEP